MTGFWDRLKALNPPSGGRRWVYVPYDQLSDQFGPLAREPAAELGIVLIENPAKAARRPYHRQKLAWILCQQRQFGLEQAARGVCVRYRVGDYAQVLQGFACRAQLPAEWELRNELAPLAEQGSLHLIPHEGWLTTPGQFLAQGGPPWRMDQFYRTVRRDTGILMEHGKPMGGKYSHDADNRQPWKGHPAAPQPPSYPRDALRQEVEELILREYGQHPGQLDTTTIPLTLAEIDDYWDWVKRECLPHFGPYEDAMSTRSSGLFHSRLSPLVNLHRLTPKRVVDEALKLDLPLPCKEGFVRQILGWREFVHHVHSQTEGFRTLFPVSSGPADGGWSRWSGRNWPGSGSPPSGGRLRRLAPAGADANFLDAQRDLPAAFWGAPSGLACLDSVVADVWREGWSHHITRLMILSNLATLLDVSPRQLCDWFWVAYVDAFDWVVEPNVLAMGTYGAGPTMTTKPYVSGSAYIQRMGDYCSGCSFDPRIDCPITPLYWAFVGRHRQRLANNPRMNLVLRNWDKRDEVTRGRDVEVFNEVSGRLLAGQNLTTPRA